jgi:starch phosphorylase
VVVQIYHGGVNHHGDLVETKVSHLSLVRSENNYHLYEGAYVCSETGMQGYTIRILPAHGLMEDPAELYLCHWA